MKAVLILISLITGIASYGFTGGGENGIVEGLVFKYNDDSKEPLMFVSVYAIEAQTGTKSDFDGKYKLTLPPGEHHVVFRFSGLETDTLVIVVEPQMIIEQNVEMRTKTLKTVQIIRNKTVNGGGDVTAAKETKEDTKVVTVKTRKQIESTGASDVAEATNKMTGLSTVGDVLFVRGLGDRYNVAYLNQLPLPSPNPDFRVVPMSIFPTQIINSLNVSKVMSSSLYGDFAGGAFNIVSRSYFDKPTFEVSVGSKINSQTSFRNFKASEGGKLDYLGIDDGSRSIPDFVVSNSKPSSYTAINDIFPNSSYKSIEGIGSGFNSSFDTRSRLALPGTSFSITGGNFIPVGKKEDNSSGIGYIVLLSHNQENKYSYGAIKNINAQSEERLNYDVEKFQELTQSTGLLSTHFRLNPNHNITANALFVNNSSDEVRETWGTHFDYVNKIYSRRLTYQQNYMSVNQLIGTHKFLVSNEDQNFSRLIIDWRGSYNFTGSQEPDRKQFVAFYNDGEKDNTEHYSLNVLDKNENHRFYSKLNEKELAMKGNIKYVLLSNKTENKSGKIKLTEVLTTNVGVDYKSKSRQFDYKQYNYILNNIASANTGNIDINNFDSYITDQVHDEGGYIVDEVVNFGSSYVADLQVTSAYADLKYSGKRLHIIPGVRFESGYQSVTNRNQQSPSEIDRTILNSNALLPSLITKYDLSEKDVLRFVMSKTITRPKFNELAPFQYTLFFAGAKAQGNSSLLNSTNYNADFRYEHYSRPGEMITIGAFYKYLDRPIEQTMLATASGQLMSYANADFAHVAGLEIEFVRNLSFLLPEESRDSSFLKYLGIGFNASYIYTIVQIDSTNLGAVNTNISRPLEGASPYLINLDLRYEKNDRSSKHSYLFAVAYNVFGPRLYSVGSNGIGDQYERPVSTLNFVSKIGFNKKFYVGLKAKNLLNPSIKIVQEDKVNDGYIDVSQYKRGMDVSISLGYKF